MSKMPGLAYWFTLIGQIDRLLTILHHLEYLFKFFNKYAKVLWAHVELAKLTIFFFLWYGRQPSLVRDASGRWHSVFLSQ